MATTTTNRREAILDFALAKLETDKILVPGAKAALREQILATRGGPGEAIEILFAKLDGPDGAIFLDPDRPSASKSVLRRVLAVLPVTARAKARLEERLGMEANATADLAPMLAKLEAGASANGIPFDKKAETARLKGEAAGKLVERVFDELEDRSQRFAWYDNFVPPLPVTEVRTQRLLGDFQAAGHLASSVDVDELAQRWAGAIGILAPDKARQEIARRLSWETNRHLVDGGEPITITNSDPAMQPTSADRQEEAATSQYVNDLKASYANI